MVKYYLASSLGVALIFLFLLLQGEQKAKPQITPKVQMTAQESGGRVGNGRSTPSLLEQTLSKERKKALEVGNQLKALSDLKGTLGKDKLRHEKLAKIAEDPAAVEIASRTLLDIDWAGQLYGKNQAEVRIFSVQLLREKALSGDVRHLEVTGQELARQLQENTSNWQRGREHDLTDLLGAWIEAEGIEETLKNPEGFLKRFHYSPKLKWPFMRAVYSYLRKGQLDESAGQIFSTLWRKDFT